ncbi:MAG: GMC family oxidoreductase [Microlunatus sp.]|nr:GMC family oxidoreductase [Microlunatus sp.]
MKQDRLDHEAPKSALFDAVVVGSGFGGAVAAARLAQAGLRVAVLERGRRWPRGSFPRDSDDLKQGWLWHSGRGLFDIRWLDRMLSVQGAGWGGGSLIYANVFARPLDETFRPYWPASYSRAALDRYFDLAAYMLEVRPVQPDPRTGELPVRTRAMEDLVARMDRAAGTVRPNLAVRFAAEPDGRVLNRHGVPQYGCTFVGECVLGCNQGAKNSLDYNYLAVAERAGAVAFTDSEVIGLDPGADAYAVTYRNHADGGRRQVLTGRTVFLAAGAVGTTELLLRARDLDRTLPDLSPRLGEGFSGNGDFLAIIRRSRIHLDAGHGPTITTSSVVDFDEAGGQVWFQVQDGAYPAVLSQLVAGLDPIRGVRERVVRWGARMPTGRQRRRSMMALLLMGRDASAGRLALDHHNQATVAWDNRANRSLYRAEGQVARAVARMLGGRASSLPTWSLLRRAITVHNLGGVPMGVDRTRGVINEYGEVHGYPGMYVVDGSAVPSATGVNPSASILAMAERNVERAIRGLIGDEQWEAPEMKKAEPAPVPEERAMQSMSMDRRQRSGHGVRFRESMTGRLRLGGVSRTTRVTLDAQIAGWAPFLRDASHPVSLTGTVDIEGIATARPVSGTLELFPDAGDVAMRYRLRTHSESGDVLELVGVKHQRPANPLHLWADLTTLWFETDAVTGVLRMSVPGTLRLVGSIRGDAFLRRQRVAAAARFLGYFARGAVRGVLRA